MKKYIWILLVACFIASYASGQENQGFVLKAKIDNPKGYSPYYLGYFYNNDYVVETNYTIDGDWVVFKGSVDEPVVASFGVRGNPTSVIMLESGGMIPGPSLEFFLSNDEIEIVGDADLIYMAEVKGGKANKDWSEIKAKENELTKEVWLKMKTAFDNFKPGDDSTAFETASKTRIEALEKTAQLREGFMNKYPNSIVSMYFLSSMVNSLELPELKESFAKLGEEFKSSSFGESISEKINSTEATAIGKEAIAIHKIDIDGNPINLETLKGKYVLIDFWGSWCSPCRESFPHLKELYAKYKDDGFEILGIAQESRGDIEDSRKAWKKAITEDGLPWLQVLNNEGVDQFDAVKAYGVTAFPTQILLDKEGKIVARYVGESADLDIKLKEVFGK